MLASFTNLHLFSYLLPSCAASIFFPLTSCILFHHVYLSMFYLVIFDLIHVQIYFCLAISSFTHHIIICCILTFCMQGSHTGNFSVVAFFYIFIFWYIYLLLLFIFVRDLQRKQFPNLLRTVVHHLWCWGNIVDVVVFIGSMFQSLPFC